MRIGIRQDKGAVKVRNQAGGGGTMRIYRIRQDKVAVNL